MSVRFVTKTMHAYLDYPVAIGLIALPVFLDLGQSNPIAFWLSFLTGFAALALTILTDHQTGIIRILPYSVHLAVDFAVGIVFLAAPIALGFTGLDFAYYLVNAIAVLTVVSLAKPQETVAQAA
ncbi:hypothetical protein [Roseibium aggregatum]|uniref:hypothetical protein n=1 Tax=Roseibium aggregatum TaxID=187304 RepID=UPI00094B70D0|nr:hypothetical protein [Roseibium aggregatum]UFI02464.1 hypothetical protein ST40_020970 [Roseibium aggregatum]